jgi:hypothetical protein
MERGVMEGTRTRSIQERWAGTGLRSIDGYTNGWLGAPEYSFPIKMLLIQYLPVMEEYSFPIKMLLGRIFPCLVMEEYSFRVFMMDRRHLPTPAPTTIGSG